MRILEGRMHLIRKSHVRWMLVLAVLPAMAAATWFASAHERRHDPGQGAAASQYIVLLKRGPKWIPNKSFREQPLLEHGHYLNQQMQNGKLQLAGPFLDSTGGLVVYNAKDDTEARAIAEHDPGIVSQVLQVDSIHPFLIAFDAATGKSPFQSQK
jgi:uncharacterized protein